MGGLPKIAIDLSVALAALEKLNSVFSNKIGGIFEHLLILSALKTVSKICKVI